MGEFMTQPLTGADALPLMAAIIVAWTFFLWLVGFLWHKKDADERFSGFQNYIYKGDKELRDFRSEIWARVNELDEEIDTISDNLWVVSYDVADLQVPAWKKLLRKLSA